MTPIQTNKTVFFDKAGDPLAGSIYIGQPSQDPRTSPKTVTLRDSGGVEFTASQPLTVSQGRVVYNGKPIVALVDGDHSMLTFDAAGTQVDYSQLVEPASGSGSPADFSEVIRVGLTLSEIKAFNVSVGDTVRNVGEVTATDGLGKDWLAVSATGSPGDDITLINFANGLQGSLLTTSAFEKIAPDIASGDFNPSEPALVWSGSSTSVPATALSSSGPGIYVLVTSAVTISFYVFSTSSTNAQGGGSYTFSNKAYSAWITGGGGGSFKVSAWDVDSPYSQTLQTITAIYKV